MALPITGGNGSPTGLTNTQTPQSSVGPSTNATASGNVQPGTASSLLSTSTAQGISLKSQTLPTVTVSGASTGTIQQAAKDTKTSATHHANGLLIGIAVVLLVAAAVFFVVTARSDKNTTK
ncbi:MAG TPA: hypothetical protein VHC21_01250 [Candidatus Saccharimonadales bacterium]|nr:hypothetical protein [Candidatus Saccharimonadales bacterium]